MLLWDDDNQLYLPANHYGAMIRVKGPDDENIMARVGRGVRGGEMCGGIIGREGEQIGGLERES